MAYIWYAAYGSNISFARFMRYINRCTNTDAPVASRPLTIPYDIYFAAQAKTWDNKGVAFLDDTKPGMAYGRMYLITEEQFLEVQRMEGPKYTKGIQLGIETGAPIYTFTSPEKRTDVQAPSEAYFNTILSGLVETYPEMEEKELAEYLSGRI